MTDENTTREKKPSFYEWSPVFLEALAHVPNVSRAAREAGIQRQLAYYHRDNNEAFRNAWDNAIEVGVDRLEEEMWRRAVEGTEKPVYYEGKRVDALREYSDTLAIFLAKAHRPERFRDRYDVTSGGDRLEVLIRHADD